MKNTLPLEEVIILGVMAEGRFSVILTPEEYHTRLHLRCMKRESLLQNVLTAVCHLQVSIQSIKYELWWLVFSVDKHFHIQQEGIISEDTIQLIEN